MDKKFGQLQPAPPQKKHHSHVDTQEQMPIKVHSSLDVRTFFFFFFCTRQTFVLFSCLFVPGFVIHHKVQKSTSFLWSEKQAGPIFQ